MSADVVEGYNGFKIELPAGMANTVYTLEVIQDNDVRRVKLFKAK